MSEDDDDTSAESAEPVGTNPADPPEAGPADLTDPPWSPRRPPAVVAEIAEWPIPRRERWGRRANELEDAGVAFPESERQAYREIKAAMEEGSLS